MVPNFCGSCGQSLNGSVASGPTIRRPRQSAQNVEADADREIDRVPLINKLEYEIEGVGAQKMKLRDVMLEQPSENKVKRSNQSPDRPIAGPKDVLMESMDICKSARTKPPEDVE